MGHRVSKRAILPTLCNETLGLPDLTYRSVQFIRSNFNNTFYQVEPKLRGLRLRVHFDLFADEIGMLATVELFSEQGNFLGVGRRYERQRCSHEQPKATTPDKLEKSAYLKTILQSLEQEMASKRHDRISFQDEIAALNKLYEKHLQVQQSHVRTAFEQSSSASFSSMFWDLPCQLAESPKRND